ncbi:hypothetical protein BVX95_01430 [archaeon D22]|nr:hypothetical protein BVX95_01430 [archaeon D22]
MINEILSILYLLVPAYFANMIPVIAKKIDFLNYPLDFGKKINGKRILGTNKTFRGLFFGTLAGGLVFYIQKIAHIEGFRAFSYIEYTEFGVWFGFLIGFVTIVGDALESFVKRQLDKKPGKPWVPWDQLDFVIANFIVLSFIIDFSLVSIILTSIVVTLGDMVVQYSGYKLGMKDDFL